MGTGGRSSPERAAQTHHSATRRGHRSDRSCRSTRSAGFRYGGGRAPCPALNPPPRLHPTPPPPAVVTVPPVPAAPLGVPGLGTAGAVPLAAPLTALLDPTSPIGRALGAYTVTTPLGGYSVPGFVAPGTSTLAGSMPTIPVGGAFGSVPAGQIVGAP